MFTPRLESHPRPLAPLLLAFLALGACSSTSQSTPHVRIDSPPVTAKVEEPEDNLLASVTIAARPATLAVDGDLTEWALPAPGPAAGPSGGAAPKTPRDPQEPASRVTVAMSSAGLALAGEMSTAHEKGFWVAVLFGMPEVPAIGYWQRGGGVAPLDCDEERMTPDELAECKALVDAHESFAAEHVARFQSHYFVSPTGVSVERSGVLTPVVGAQVAFKPSGQGLRVEATLPSKALPRTQQAPLSSFHAYVRGGEPSKAPHLPSEEWSSLTLPQPVGFEPHAALREVVFGAAERHPPYKPFSMSYQPGDGLEVEDIDYASSTHLLSASEILYSKQVQSGDLEVGFAYTGKPTMGVGWTSVVSIYKGEPLAVVDLTGSALGVVKRGEDVHAFSWATWENDDGATSWSSWGIVAFGPFGVPDPDIMDDIPQVSVLVGPVESHSPDFSTFGITGALWDHETSTLGATLQATWKWDPKTKRYTASVKDLFPSAKKPPKPAQPPKAPKPPKK